MSTATTQTQAKVAAARSLDSRDSESVFEQAPKQAQKMIDQARRQLHDLASATECYVQREPMKALAIAAVVGGLAGMLLNRMR